MAPLISFSGIASGIDSDSLIQALLEQQRAARITPLQTRIQELTDTNSAVEELSTMLAELQTTLRGMSSINGGPLSRIASSSNETYVSATAGNSAANGSYTLNVIQKATNETDSLRSTAGAYSSSTALIASGINDGDPAVDRTVSFSIGTSSPETVDVEITSGMTMQDFVDNFNSQSDRATASIVNAGTDVSPDYRIMISSKETGTAEGAIGITVGASVLGQGVFDDNTESDATDAQFTVSGIGGTITRSSNTVSDLISGVTFQLNAVGSATLTIAADADSTKSKVSEFVEKFNEIVEFVRENNVVSFDKDGSGGSKAVFAALSGTNVDDGLIASLRSAISSSSYSGGSAVSIFANLGITTQRDGTLAFDEDVFDEAIGSEPESVEAILRTFADTTSLTGGTIDHYIRFNGLLDLTKNSNNSTITSNEDRIARYEEQLARFEEQQRLRFSRLESVVGKMQQQQSALNSALLGLQQR